jgi:hypothetical protein
MPIFGLVESGIIAILGLCVAGGSSVFTAFAFLKTYGRNRKSEQIRIAREIRDKINIGVTARHEFNSKNEYPDKASIEEKRRWILDLISILDDNMASVNYFTFLVEQKEIDDESVLKYYKVGILQELKQIEKAYAVVEEEVKSDTGLYVAVADSIAEDLTSGIARLRRKLLHHKKVWEHE